MGITYKELLWLKDPDDVNEAYVGGCLGCPDEGWPCDKSNEYKCRECWNKEIPYSVIAEAIRDGYFGFEYKAGEKFLLERLLKLPGDVDIFIRPMDGMFPYIINNRDKDDFKFYIDKEKEREDKANMRTFKVGDKVRIEGTIGGCRGAEGKIGFVTDDGAAHGLNDGKSTIHVKVSEGKVWSVNEDSLHPVDYTLSDLKDGMIVEVGDGSRELFLNGKFHADTSGLGYVQENLTNSFGSVFDVVKVFAPSPEKGFQNMLNNPGELLWERKEVKEISAEEMFRVLSEYYGCDVKIKKEESI